MPFKPAAHCRSAIHHKLLTGFWIAKSAPGRCTLQLQPYITMMQHACQEAKLHLSPKPPVALDICLHLLDICLAALGGLFRFCHAMLRCLQVPRRCHE